MIALKRHAEIQTPHLIHFSVSITYVSLPGTPVIALAGQLRAQSEHFLHNSGTT